MSKAKNLKAKVIEDSEEDSDSDIPLISAKPTKKQQVEEKKVAKKTKPAPKEESEEDDTPVVEKKPTKQVKTETAPVRKASLDKKKPAKKQSSSEEESEEVKPKKQAVKPKSPVQKPVVQKKKAQESSEEEESEQAPKPKKGVAVAAKPVAKKPAKKETSSEEEVSQEEVKPVKKATKSPVQKAKSPLQKPVVPKKKVQQSSEQSEQEEVKPAKKTVQPVKAQKVVPKKKETSEQQQSSEEKPVKKVAKSPVQKPIVQKKKPEPVKQDEESEQQQQEKPQPVRKGSKDLKGKKPVKSEMVDEDEEGQFEVCVQGLSFNAYDSDIRGLFDQCGNVTDVKLLTRSDGKSKGTAFVKFSKKSSFNKALELNGTEHFDRTIKVEQSQGKKDFGGQQQQRGGNFGGNNSYGGNKGGNFQKPASNANIETPTLFIGGLSYNSTVESIKSFFSQAGQVASARIVTDRETGKARGFGYVEFHDVDTAKKAYQELNGGNLDGRNIRLDSAAQRDRPQGGQGGRGGFGGGFGASSRNPGNSTVVLSQDDKNAKKGAIGTFQGKKLAL